MKGKKLIAYLLSVAMAVSMIGCGDKDSGKDEKPDAASVAENDASESPEAEEEEIEPSGAEEGQEDAPGTEEGTGEYFKKYDEEISLTTHMVYPTTWKWLEGYDANNNGQTKWLKSHMGINMSCVWEAPDSPTDMQKLELAFAADNLPDLIQVMPAQVAKYAAAGKLVDIKALIEEYGSPLLKYMVEDRENITQGALFQPYTYEGKAYALPIMCDTLVNWNLNYIREDILEELNMEVPGSIDELEAVFEAYKAKYPQGVALGLDNDLQTGKMQLVMSAYQAYPKSWVEKDGQLVYGSIQPEVKEGLARMAEWYQKGYIDPEFVTKDSDRLNQDIAAGDVLSFWAAWWFVLATGQDLWTGVEGSEVIAMPFLTDANGNSGIMNSVSFAPGRAITTKCEHPEAFIYILNEYLDSFYRNDEALREKMKNEYQYEFKYPVTEPRDILNPEEYLDKLELETFTRIIMGTEPVDAFDTFVEEWNANGGEAITAEVNEWYQSMQ